MSETSRLSPMTSYYLRKFLEDRQTILHELLPELPGEITLDRLFERMSRQGKATNQLINVIESLVEIHKKVVKSAPPESMEVQSLDKRLLLSLGVDGTIAKANQLASVSVAKDCVEILNSIRTKALFFLGDTIGTKYLLETRPSEQWCQQFKIEPRAKVSYEGQLNEGLNPDQVSCFESWVDSFAERCGNIMLAFNQNGGAENEALFENL